MTKAVAYFITELNIGGAEKVLTHFLGTLDRSEYDPVVICLYGGNSSIADEIRLLNIPVYDLQMTSKWRLDVIWRLYRLLRNLKPVILHSSLFHANVLGRIVGRLAGVPIIISCRQNISIGGQWRELLNRYTVTLDDAVIAVCELARITEIEQTNISPDRVVTIYNAIDITHLAIEQATARQQIRQEFQIAEDTFLMGTVCRFHPQKGLAHWVDAFALIQQRLEDPAKVHLILVGDGELRLQLEEKVRSLGLTESVTFTGFRTDIPQILAAFDLFVLPSLWEGLSVVVLEAMASGLPVVATSVGGTPELVIDGETGLLVPPNDSSALSTAILALVQDEFLRNEMGRRGVEQVRQKFSAQTAVQATTALYKRLLNERIYPQRK